jgi:hypothetical protein
VQSINKGFAVVEGMQNFWPLSLTLRCALVLTGLYCMVMVWCGRFAHRQFGRFGAADCKQRRENQWFGHFDGPRTLQVRSLAAFGYLLIDTPHCVLTCVICICK